MRKPIPLALIIKIYFSLLTDYPRNITLFISYLSKWNKNCGSAVIKPVGEVLLPRISGILSSSLCKHQQIRNQHNCRPRIPREQCPCGFSHRLLQCDVDGVSSFSRHFHVPCRPLRLWHLVLNTLHHWMWNTIACSMHGSCRDEDCHSKKHATQ